MQAAENVEKIEATEVAEAAGGIELVKAALGTGRTVAAAVGRGQCQRL